MQPARTLRREGPQASAAPQRGARALVGPNAAIQLAAALSRAGLDDFAREIFANAGVSAWLAHPPEAMIDEGLAAFLHQSVRDRLPPERAHGLLEDAGRLTADYLLEHRIPAPFKALLKVLPRGLAQRAFLAAIRRHAWTFVGTGRFSSEVGSVTVLEIRGNPFCARERRAAPACDWHAAVFERLFGQLIGPTARVEEVACEACGDEACRFTLRWDAAPSRRNPARMAK